MFAGLCLIGHAEPSPESPLESPAEALLQLAGDFSPRYEMVRPHLVVVDVSGLGRLLGTPREIGEAFCRIARDRELTVAVGIASTQTAALLLALHQATTARVGSAPTASVAPVVSVEPAKLADAAADAHARAQRHEKSHVNADRLAVARLGREAEALAPLPLSLLAALPSDRLTNDDVAFLRRRPDPSSPSSSSASSSSTSSSSTSSSSTSPALTGMGGASSHEAASARGRLAGRRVENVAVEGAELSSRAVSLAVGRAGACGRSGADVLRRWGLKTLGEFAALPADALFERLGP